MEKKTSFLRVIFFSVLSLIIFVILLFLFIWRNEIKTMNSIEIIQNPVQDNDQGSVYEMTVSGDYYLEDFIKNGGAGTDAELISFLTSKIAKGIIPMQIESPEIGCAAFSGVTEEGDYLFGRSYDFSKTSSMIVHTNPGGGRLKSISSVDLQFLGIKDGSSIDSFMDKVISLAATYAPIDGMNEEGVSIGVLMTYQGETTVATAQKTDLPDFTTTSMIRLVLDYAHDVDEAIEILKQYDMNDSAGTSYHFMIADATGKSAIVEYVNGTDLTDNDGSKREMKVTYNDNDSKFGENEGKNNFQYVTNFILEPGYYEKDEDKAGLDRYKKIETMINPDGSNTKGIISEEEGLDVLQTIGRRSWDKINGASDKNVNTVWSALYNLTDKTVTWVSNEGFDNEGAVFKFSLLEEK